MGGNIAQTFVLTYPERVEKLILAASFAVMNQQARLFLDAVLSVYEGGATTKQMFDLIAPWLFSASFLNEPDNAAYLVYDENDPDQQPFYAWKNQYLAQQSFNVVSRLHEIKTPTLIISGEMDRLAHLEDSLLLTEKIEHAILKTIPKSGHLINFEYPDLFHSSVLEFL
ncbi:alpha/beta fold hydrolase [Paenibacillus qinlingensis]|uniref:alpha/beta fold hydrolase n=1 Tax=Paenibacillus qinlingensis TaxID=1837343 RepID=UPI0015665DD4|nr:alpha/beta hydrolase [Paenibacillus qinlingensis]